MIHINGDLALNVIFFKNYGGHLGFGADPEHEMFFSLHK